MCERQPRSKDDAPAALYFGKVMHARLKPVVHRFNYRVFSLLIDLDQLSEAHKMSPIFSVNRSNISSFYEKDHGKRDGSSLRQYIDGLLLECGIERPHRIRLWCNPRILGYTFNPLSIYFCENETGETTALVYQVNNTFGESHSYIAKVDLQQNQKAAIRNSANKCFYVSPFLDMALRYDFRINPPDKNLRIRILEHDKNGPILSATFKGERHKLDGWNLLKGTFSTLGLAWKIMAGIHYEALILWMKGMKLRKRPIPPVHASFINEGEKLTPGE